MQLRAVAVWEVCLESDANPVWNENSIVPYTWWTENDLNHELEKKRVARLFLWIPKNTLREKVKKENISIRHNSRIDFKQHQRAVIQCMKEVCMILCTHLGGALSSLTQRSNVKIKDSIKKWHCGYYNVFSVRIIPEFCKWNRVTCFWNLKFLFYNANVNVAVLSVSVIVHLSVVLTSSG